MDINLIKRIFEKEDGKVKVFIIEEGKPTLVISSFEDYQEELLAKRSEKLIKTPKNTLTQLPERFLQKEARLEEAETTRQEKKEEEANVTLEDLPL